MCSLKPVDCASGSASVEVRSQDELCSRNTTQVPTQAFGAVNINRPTPPPLPAIFLWIMRSQFLQRMPLSLSKKISDLQMEMMSYLVPGRFRKKSIGSTREYKRLSHSKSSEAKTKRQSINKQINEKSNKLNDQNSQKSFPARR